jgi:aminoglycoside phosphotransferase (APT) family kinase protein
MDDQQQSDRMRRVLEDGLTRIAGKPVRIRELRRELLSYASSFAAEQVDAVLEDGKHMEVFFKDLHPDHQLVDAQRVRERSLERSWREVEVYRRLLARWSFDTPQLYAVHWDPESDVYWLFLELISGKKVSKLADPAVWHASARWVARFHVTSRRIPADEIAFLPRLDTQHFRECRERLEAKLPELEADDRRLAEDALVLYAAIEPRLTALPQSLIHGEFFGKNIMVRLGAPDRTIAAIDWETAAVGPSYLDIASLSSGDWTPEIKQGMRRAYFDTYQRESGVALDWDQFCDDVLDVSLYQCVRWLAWWPGRAEAKQFGRWMNELTIVLR